jgi:hypothetical protein
MQNNHQSMRGQWMGKSTGTNSGTVIANFDELQSHYQVTNLDDIESYIKAKESTNGKQYLWAIDMPVRDRKQVIQELNFMHHCWLIVSWLGWSV